MSLCLRTYMHVFVHVCMCVYRFEVQVLVYVWCGLLCVLVCLC